MSRRALALASSIAIVGCSDAETVAPPYGAPYDAAALPDVHPADTSSETTSDDSGPADSGTTEDSGSDVEDTGGPLPPYGLPPSDGG